MSAQKNLLINISFEPQPEWGDLVRLLDEFKAGQGGNVEITGKDLLSYLPLSDLIKEIIDRDMKPTARVMVSAINYKDLSKVVLFLKNKRFSAICFTQPDMTTLTSENYSLLVSTKEMLPHLLEAIKVMREEGLAYYFENLPLCILPGEENNLIFSGKPGVKMLFCENCELSPRCGGITKAQLIAEYGTQLVSWQFLFPKNFFSDQDIAFLDEVLLKSSNLE